jgi:hypothetical protein
MNKIAKLSIMKDYWTELEIQALKNVATFEEMVPVALTILKKMHLLGKPIHQICGPISTGGKGSIEANMVYFHRAIQVAHEQGLLVFDQTPFQDAMVRLAADHDARKEYCTDILHVFYRGVFKSGLVDTLLFLPDWQSSFGATWEWNEAKELGLTAKDYPAEWLHLLE